MRDEGVWRKIAQSRMNVLQQYQDGCGREKGIGRKNVVEEAQSNRMCYGSIKRVDVGGRVMRDEGVWRKIAQSRMNVLQQYQMGGVGKRVMRDEGVWWKIAQSNRICYRHGLENR